MNLLLHLFFHVLATTAIYTLSLHDALPILIGHVSKSLAAARGSPVRAGRGLGATFRRPDGTRRTPRRSLVSTDEQIGRAQSELQSRRELVCRLLLEKKKILVQCIKS